mmetsp:Transcript_33143/g.61833  ORF Transcript_33143/g.61833 Transcript_33143/m.61833 type:complete len:228 (-) Transcript_33143:93-776(-)
MVIQRFGAFFLFRREDAKHTAHPQGMVEAKSGPWLSAWEAAVSTSSQAVVVGRRRLPGRSGELPPRFGEGGSWPMDVAGLPSPRGLFVLFRTEVLDDARVRRSSRRRSPSCRLGEQEESCCCLLEGCVDWAEDAGRSVMSDTLIEPPRDESDLPEAFPLRAVHVPDEVRRLATFCFTGSLTAFRRKPGGGVSLFSGGGGPCVQRGGTCDKARLGRGKFATISLHVEP